MFLDRILEILTLQFRRCEFAFGGSVLTIEDQYALKSSE